MSDVTKTIPESNEPPPSEHVEESGDETTNDSNATQTIQTASESSAPTNDKSESVKWVIDNNFRKELIRLGISEDPAEW